MGNVQMLLPEIEAMIAEGKTQCEVAEHFGVQNKYVGKSCLSGSERSSENWRRGSCRITVTEESILCQFFEVSRSGYYDFIRCLGGPDHADRPNSKWVTDIWDEKSMSRNISFYKDFTYSFCFFDSGKAHRDLFLYYSQSLAH